MLTVIMTPANQRMTPATSEIHQRTSGPAGLANLISLTSETHHGHQLYPSKLTGSPAGARAVVVGGIAIECVGHPGMISTSWGEWCWINLQEGD